MGKSKKNGLLERRKSALARLEAQYEKFKSAGEDKPSWTTTRNGKPKTHLGRSFADECKRFNSEIDKLKENISKTEYKS